MLDVDMLIKRSLVNKDKTSLKVFRNLKTDIMVFKTQKNAPSYDEAAEIKIIQKYVTKMEDAEKQYLQANREDLVSECRDELSILRTLLPEPVNPKEIEDYLTWYCINGGFTADQTLEIPKKYMSTIIKDLKKEFPTADGKIISEIIKKYVI